MMEIFIYIYLFIIGLVLGSFYNVVGIRMADKISIIRPRSHCPNCRQQLKVAQLIPVISYMIQKGRCINCQTKISIKYPLFELLTASLFTISPMLVGWSKELLIFFVLISLVIIITISDLYKMLIPNKVLLFFGIVIFIFRFFIPTDPWWDAYAGALLGFGLLLLIAVVSKGGMGGGDIKLFAVVGLFLGVKGTVLTLVLAAVFGMLFGFLLMMLKKFKRGQPIPFGPFIGLAALISYVYSDTIWAFYLGFYT